MSYEPEKVRVRPVLWVLAATFGFLAIAMGVVFAWQQATFGEQSLTRPDEPQVHWEAPVLTLELHEAVQRARLAGYHWVDREAGVVRIPIRRAMELVVEEAEP